MHMHLGTAGTFNSYTDDYNQLEYLQWL